jgi:hypothetical protein
VAAAARRRAVVLPLAAALCASAAHGSTPLYECRGADGARRMQDRPCAVGEQELLRGRVDIGPDTPRHDPKPAESVPVIDAAPVRAAAETEAVAVVPTWRCIDHEGRGRDSDDGVPRVAWVPLWVVGADPRAPLRVFGDEGRPGAVAGPRRPSAPAVAGFEPMVRVEERCLRLDGDAACRRYRQARDEVRRALLLAMPSARPPLEARAQELALRLRACR